MAQFRATTDKAANLATIESLVKQAASRESRLVVLPENAMYSNPDPTADITADTEPLDGPFASAVAGLARQHGLAIVVGMTEAPAPGGQKATNAVLAVDEHGDQIGVYRKVHLYDAFGYRESDRVEAHPPRALTFGIDGLTFGVMTCYDLRFPEMARFLVDAGADAIVVPAEWAVGPAKEDHWVTLARARAMENTAYVLACGQTGPTCTGQSIVVDPMGMVVASAGEGPGLASATITAARVTVVRAKNPSLSHRRFTVVAR
ncbi:carbon-nitrogen hydrolase family protein [Micromonospora sp. B11E3]|uniref:carbon-nitrogen hydrolase family protein n=1 Tax=Micromonospora sp. B11E3 TaxID=3153562 RepID=UPI00325E45AC